MSNAQFFQEDADINAWMVTYADLVTLLLVFFILLFTMSALHQKKFNDAVLSIRASMGNADKKIGVADIIDASKSADNRESKFSREKEVVKDIQRFIEERRMSKHVVVFASEGKITIQIDGKILFESGTALLNKTAAPILSEITKFIDEYHEFIVNIKGHTDDIPINTKQFPSNWELSAYRATTVLKFLVRNGIDPKRLTATGYGAIMPIAPNDTAENRSRNRRVEFVLERKKETF